MSSASHAGRKPIAGTGECMKGRAVRMTDAEWEQCQRLGGAAWIRARLAAERQLRPETAEAAH